MINNTGILIFGLILTSIVLIYIIITLRRLYFGEDKIRDSITQHYENKGLIVNDVSELNFTERIKFGVPIISIFKIYSYYFGLMSGKFDYVRKVNVMDKKDNEYTKYIELIIQEKEIISFKEFASYDI